MTGVFLKVAYRPCTMETVKSIGRNRLATIIDRPFLGRSARYSRFGPNDAATHGCITGVSLEDSSAHSSHGASAAFKVEIGLELAHLFDVDDRLVAIELKL